MTRLLFIALFTLAMTGRPVLAQQKTEQQTQPRRWDRDDGAPKVGEVAPTFKLLSLDGKNETDLNSFRGKRPVILCFGSYT